MKKLFNNNPVLAILGLLLFVYWISFSSSTIPNNQLLAQVGTTIEVDYPQHLMGEGRVNVELVNSSGECQVDDLKISRSKPVVHWGNAASACPANWWVCTAAEREVTQYCKDIYASDPIAIDCRLGNKPSLTEQGGNSTAWVADINPDFSERHEGMVIDASNSDVKYGVNHCSTRPVWCCTK